MYTYLHLGTPFATWSALYRKPPTPNTRTLDNLCMGAGRRANKVAGHRTTRFTIQVFEACFAAHTWVSLENPADSWLLACAICAPTYHCCWQTSFKFSSPVSAAHGHRNLIIRCICL
jgi:hypothetical protein